MESRPNPYASPAGELPAAVRAMLASAAGRHARFESAQPRARRAVAFFYGAMGLLFLELVYHGVLVFFVLRIETGVGMDVAEARGIAIADLALGVLHLLVRVALLWTFLLWFSRAYRNLPSLGADELQLSANEAVLSFFIPFVNFVRPYQLLKRIWRGSDLSVVDPGQKIVFSAALVGYWWTFLWISIVLRIAAWYTNRIAGQEGDTFIGGEAIVAVWFSIGAILMQMIAALLGLHVVKTITDNQDEKHRRIELERHTNPLATDAAPG